jgi:hypothetical protein
MTRTMNTDQHTETGPIPDTAAGDAAAPAPPRGKRPDTTRNTEDAPAAGRAGAAAPVGGAGPLGDRWAGGNHPGSCSGCGRRWNSARIHHCSACHHSFSGGSLFDTHRTRRGTHGGCLDPARLRTGGGRLRLLDGVWCGPARPEDTWGASSE